jgi:hypothetical protein
MVVFLSCFLYFADLHAEDNSCWLTAPIQDDIWVKVHDTDRDGNRGSFIWKGKIEAGKAKKIESTEGYIRYDFTRDRNQPYEGDISVGCFGQKRLSVD